MTNKENILQELNELKSTLANVTPQNVYTIPVGYFDGLALQVLNRIKAMEAKNAAEELGYLSTSLSNISRQMPYVIPSGYFEGFAEKAMQLVRESNDYLQKESFGQTAKEELEVLSPLLSGLNKIMPYSVPQGYFESLGEKRNKPETKIISITSRKWFRYAVAAVVTGLIVMSGFMLFNKKANMAGLPLAKYEKKLNKEIKKMSDKELNDFLQYTNAGLSGEEKVSNNPTDDVKDLLKDVPESELKEFLEETSDVETITLMMN